MHAHGCLSIASWFQSVPAETSNSLSYPVWKEIPLWCFAWHMDESNQSLISVDTHLISGHLIRKSSISSEFFSHVFRLQWCRVVCAHCLLFWWWIHLKRNDLFQCRPHWISGHSWILSVECAELACPYCIFVAVKRTNRLSRLLSGSRHGKTVEKSVWNKIVVIF